MNPVRTALEQWWNSRQPGDVIPTNDGKTWSVTESRPAPWPEIFLGEVELVLKCDASETTHRACIEPHCIPEGRIYDVYFDVHGEKEKPTVLVSLYWKDARVCIVPKKVSLPFALDHWEPVPGERIIRRYTEVLRRATKNINLVLGTLSSCLSDPEGFDEFVREVRRQIERLKRNELHFMNIMMGRDVFVRPDGSNAFIDLMYEVLGDPNEGKKADPPRGLSMFVYSLPPPKAGEAPTPSVPYPRGIIVDGHDGFIEAGHEDLP